MAVEFGGVHALDVGNAGLVFAAMLDARGVLAPAHQGMLVMSDLDPITIGREFLYFATLLTLPALAVSLLVGLVISIFQAVTSIQEQTLSFAPRILALAGLFVVLMPWMLEMSVFFTTQMLARAAHIGQ